MIIAAYEVREFEEKDFAKAKDYGLEIKVSCPARLTLENAYLSEGCEGVTVLGLSKLDKPLLKKLKALGVKYVATRTIGFNHIDVKCAKQLGMRVGNAHYAPYNVADFAVMLMLVVLRKVKISVCRALVNDFSLDGMNGREMRSLTVGIIGAGKIGKTVIQNLSGFGCRILCYDPFVSADKIPAPAKAATLEEIYAQSDIISLHTPLTESNFHMIDKAAFAKMKRGVILINTARGGLVDTKALCDALESGQVAGAGLDTVEGEEITMHKDLRAGLVKGRDFFYLKQLPNAIITPHYAFFTDEASTSMVESALSFLSLIEKGAENPYEI